ncbi:MAG: 2-oxoacid:acceptor oxidoreductase family protein [Thermoleophilia bacterium]
MPTNNAADVVNPAEVVISGGTSPAAATAATSSRFEVRLTGSGGQGLLLAATILGDAAVATGKEVLQTQSYGPEARGGASRAEVIISTAEIDYPELEAPDVTLCLSQESFNRFAAGARPGGLVVYDSGLVTPVGDVPGARLVGVPFTDLATEQVGKAQAANVVALGALQQLTGMVELVALEESLRRRLPAKLVEANLRALQAGAAAVV